MKNNITKAVVEWKILTDDITKHWIRDVWEIDKDEEIDLDWVNNDIGSVFFFADYYISFSNILDYYKYNVTKEQFINWYDVTLEQSMKGLPTINLYTFVKNPQERKEQQKKQLKALKERVKFAEEELKKAIENYEDRD